MRNKKISVMKNRNTLNTCYETDDMLLCVLKRIKIYIVYIIEFNPFVFTGLLDTVTFDSCQASILLDLD